MWRWDRFLFALGALLLWLPALAQDKPILAVMEIEDKTGKFTDTQIQEAATYLRSKLEVAGTFMVVPKSRQEKALIRELRKESYKDCYAEQCQIELGKELAADTILKSRVTKFAGTCTLSNALVSLGSAASVGGASADFDCSEKGLKYALDAVLPLLTGLDTNKPTRSSARTPEGKIGEEAVDWEPEVSQRSIVQFASDPPGAVVIANGELLCQATPCSKDLKAGIYQISMAVEGERYQRRKESVTVEDGVSLNWKLTPNFGYVTVDSIPGGLDVEIDGRVVGKTPLQKVELGLGSHKVLVKSRCHYPAGENVVITRGKERIVTVALKERQGALDIRALDADGNAIPAKIFAGDKPLGKAPGVYKLGICTRNLAMVHKGRKQTVFVDIVERQTSKQVVKFAKTQSKPATYRVIKTLTIRPKKTIHPKKTLTTTDIMKVVKSKKKLMRNCFARFGSGASSATIRTKLTVSGSDGSVSSVTMSSMEFAGTPLGNCILGVQKQMVFPRFSKKSLTKSISVRLP